MTIRLRFPELLKEHEVTGYKLVKLSSGRLAMSTVYRWIRCKGKVGRSLDLVALEALCDALDVEPGHVIERTKRRSRGKRESLRLLR